MIKKKKKDDSCLKRNVLCSQQKRCVQNLCLCVKLPDCRTMKKKNKRLVKVPYKHQCFPDTMQPKQDDGYRQTWALKLKIPDILTIKTGSHWIKIVSSFKI